MKHRLSLCCALLLAFAACAQTSPQRIPITNIAPSEATGMDYSPWLTDDLNNMIQNVWGWQNNKWVDVTLTLGQKSTLTSLELYDWQGVFTWTPDSFFAVNGSTQTYIGRFTGDQYAVWVTMPVNNVVAEKIVVRKYANCIPQKIKVFGIPVTTTPITPPPPTNPPPTTGTLAYGKIPIDGKRWYQLNNASSSLEPLFNNVTNEVVNTGWGKILNSYDSYYPVLDGEVINIDSLRFFDGQGSNEWAPFTLSIIDSAWQRRTIGTFTGNQYMTWRGPNPSTPNNNVLTTPVRNARYLVINTQWAFPSEIELYGSYITAPAAPPLPAKNIQLKQMLGVNAFEWDFLEPNNPLVPDPARMPAVKSFTGVRHYLDWERLELSEGSYSFNPTRSGGWNYDTMYARCKTEGIEVLTCLKTLPGWMQNYWPAWERDNESVPTKGWTDFAAPASYTAQAKVAFQFAARYGSNAAVPLNLLSVNATPRWNGDPANVVKRGLNLVKYIECDNERDKWWKGRKAYQTGREYAANLSAFYDGHKGTLGVGVGVKAADTAMKVVMGGVAATSTDYLMGMIDWCKEFRGYRADGSVDLCWDVINYHLYSNDAANSQSGWSNRGAAPEVSDAADVAKAFVDVAHRYAKDMPVWITETGYDQNQGSPLKAIAIGSKSVAQTQADWILRTALLHARCGVERVFFYQMYDENVWNSGKFSSMGFINSNRTRKPAADFLYQTNRLMGTFVYKQTTSTSPIVDRYERGGQSAYALVKPTENGSSVSYTLALGSAAQAYIYRPAAGQDSMSLQVVATQNGQVQLTVTETPMFVMASPPSPSAQLRKVQEESAVAAVARPRLQLFPNPATSVVNLRLDGESRGPVSIALYSTDGKQAAVFQGAKEDAQFRMDLPVERLAPGVYFGEVRVGGEKMLMSFVKK